MFTKKLKSVLSIILGALLIMAIVPISVSAEIEDGSVTITATDSELNSGDTTHICTGEWVVRKEATCTEDGLKTLTCNKCGNALKEIIPAIGHNYTTQKTEDGNVIQVCTNCGDSCTEEVPGEGGGDTTHTCTGEWTVTKEATCTEDGERVLICTECGNILQTEILPCAGHGSFLLYSVDGLSYYVCPYCVVVLGEGGGDDTHNCTGEWIVTREPTCDVVGLATLTCNECGKIYELMFPAIGHNYTTQKTEDGSVIQVCINCGDSYTEEIPGEGGGDATHTCKGEWVVTREATCIQDGERALVCTECGNVLQTEIICSTGHSYILTGSEDGLSYYVCEYCGEIGDVEIPGEGGGDTTHTCKGEWVVTREATCTQDGERAMICAECGKTISTETIASTGHSYTVQETESGKLYTCQNCGDSYTEEVPGEGGCKHDLVKIYGEEATCTEDGFNIYSCTLCGEYINEWVDLLGHSYSAVVTAPTCENEGYTTYTCEHCGDSYIDDYTPALGHRFGDWIIRIPATCKTTGERYTVCESCGYEIVEEIPLVDNYVIVTVVEPTCKNYGYILYRCQECGEYKTEKLPRTEHIYHAAESDGYITYTCEICGDSYTEEIPGEGGGEGSDTTHTCKGEWVVTKEATCTEDGERILRCTECGNVSTEIIPSIGHDYRTENTEDGGVIYICNNCGDSYSENVPGTDTPDSGETCKHNFIYSHSEEATYTEGAKDVYICESCGAINNEYREGDYAFCDFDKNGVVDDADFEVVENGMTSSADTSAFDFDCDGAKELSEFDLTIVKLLTMGKGFDEMIDVTGDGQSDVRDLVRMKKMMANDQNDPDCNRNGDETTDTTDLVFVSDFLLSFDKRLLNS